jgi:DNA-binding NtrC family response regulator
MEDTRECATVLLVDDDPSHLKLYSWIVARGGYRAITLSSAAVVYRCRAAELRK